MRTLTPEVVLKRFELTSEEEETALRTFSAEQLALFHTMYTDTLLLRATLKYDPENPLSQCTAAFDYDGKLKVLATLLSFSETGVVGNVRNINPDNSQE